jgi:hypothetical protein
MDFLEGVLISIPTKAGSEDGVAFENTLPRTTEGSSVDIFVQSTKNLTDVYSMPLGIETVE